ncbi:MAG TPA: universal stress protein [Gaiellaceae bacterium]
MQQPILLATDGSPSARRATEFAIRLAAATEWPLHVVTVWQVPVARLAFGEPMELPHLEESERDHGEVVLEAVHAEAEASGVHPVLHLREGDAADEICVVATVHDAQLIVVGAHGWSRGGPPGGSVSSAVRHRAHVPVVVVPVDARPPRRTAEAGMEAVGLA